MSSSSINLGTSNNKSKLSSITGNNSYDISSINKTSISNASITFNSSSNSATEELDLSINDNNTVSEKHIYYSTHYTDTNLTNAKKVRNFVSNILSIFLMDKLSKRVRNGKVPSLSMTDLADTSYDFEENGLKYTLCSLEQYETYSSRIERSDGSIVYYRNGEVIKTIDKNGDVTIGNGTVPTSEVNYTEHYKDTNSTVSTKVRSVISNIFGGIGMDNLSDRVESKIAPSLSTIDLADASYDFEEDGLKYTLCSLEEYETYSSRIERSDGSVVYYRNGEVIKTIDKDGNITIGNVQYKTNTDNLSYVDLVDNSYDIVENGNKVTLIDINGTYSEYTEKLETEDGYDYYNEDNLIKSIKKHNTIIYNNNKAVTIYTETGEIIELSDSDELTINDSTLSIVDTTNNLTTLCYEDGTIINVDANGIATVNGEAISIFGDYNDTTGQYGGDQGAFSTTYHPEILEDDKIQDIILSYWPDATTEEMESLLNNLNDTGCGYVSDINHIFSEYEGRESEFEETFGFPMYSLSEDGIIDYNYEYLILDYFCYYWTCNDDNSISEVIENSNGKHFPTLVDIRNSEQLSTRSGETFNKYLDSNNCNIKVEYDYDGFMSIVLGNKNEVEIRIYKNMSLGDNSQLTIAAADFYLYDNDNERSIYVDGGHGMTITGTTEVDGVEYLEVSSWGKKYTIDLSDTNYGSITERHTFITDSTNSAESNE